MIVIRGEGFTMDKRPCDFTGTMIGGEVSRLEEHLANQMHNFKEVVIRHAKTNSNDNIKPQRQGTNVGVVGTVTTPPIVAIGEPQEWEGDVTNPDLTHTTAEVLPLLEPIPVKDILSLDFIKVNVK